MVRATRPPRPMPVLADGTIPTPDLVVEHPDGTRGPILWTAPARGFDPDGKGYEVVSADHREVWRTLVRNASGPAVRRPTHELRPVRA